MIYGQCFLLIRGEYSLSSPTYGRGAGYYWMGRAAWLAGAADALREAIGSEIEPADRIFRDKYMAEARASLGEEGSCGVMPPGNHYG